MPVETYEQWLRRPEVNSVKEMCKFFERNDRVHQTFRKITTDLDSLGIPYAVGGGMALVGHGFLQSTGDVDLLVTRVGISKIHERLVNQGYELRLGSNKNIIDVETGVRIEFLIEGQYPGDGKRKPVVFPDPTEASVEIGGIKYLSLERLIELKLASGMTGGIQRMKDFTDVIALIQELHLPRDFSDKLNPYVREKYLELWQGLADSPQIEP